MQQCLKYALSLRSLNVLIALENWFWVDTVSWYQNVKAIENFSTHHWEYSYLFANGNGADVYNKYIM